MDEIHLFVLIHLIFEITFFEQSLPIMSHKT